MDKRIYRQCVRVIILKDKKICLGKKYINNKFICYEFPGGGKDDNSFNEAVTKECLEEVGILVKNIIDLDLKFKYEIDYPDVERSKLYRGGEDNWFAAIFDRYDKKLYGDDNDQLPYDWVTIDGAITLITKGPKSIYNESRLNAINKFISYLELDNSSLSAEW